MGRTLWKIVVLLLCTGYPLGICFRRDDGDEEEEDPLEEGRYGLWNSSPVIPGPVPAFLALFMTCVEGSTEHRLRN